ncbi:MAG TPA: PLP-dependent aminotransferase family protein [Treponema sp.]|nr:PLP-dependent aminotransferase family protein [Treponema sp.]
MIMRIDTIRLDEDSETPLYLKLADFLRSAILSGEAEGGERLPSIRRLSDAAGVNPATAVAAYRILEREGWAVARAGSGVYVREGNAPREAAARNREDGALADLASGRVVVPAGVLDMAAGAPSPGLFPASIFKALMDEVLDRDGGWAFGYQESSGWQPFRHALADYLRSSQAVDADLGDISVISGAQQGIDIAAKALLGSRDAVAVETPTYRGALAVFWSRGAETIGIPVDRDGMDLSALEVAARTRKLRLVYVIPRYQNPTTVCWSGERMRGLLALAERHDFWILEDDLLSDLSFGERRSPTCLKSVDAADRVIYLRSFSKVLMPGLRLGAMVGPRQLRDRMEGAKRATDIATDGLVQRALELYLRRNLHQAQLERLRAHYGEVYASSVRAATSLASLGVSFDPPGGGLHLWLRLPPGISGVALRGAALARGCAVVPEAVYVAGTHESGDSHVRVSFAALSAREAETGIAILGEALAALPALPGPAGLRSASVRPLL